ncbi:Subtilisin-like serine endopeptidase family protein [Hibiscus syriacus]|uniref:Subtilisin-like serine endopeptidase family protein n=1 Tax=Hibiscus syriacus TaxID=106335 RepID=A0A6A2YB95_HIBSY|nr:Subtilisin-like serine endopeptidase family protein [Hibiscus syriacus]
MAILSLSPLTRVYIVYMGDRPNGEFSAEKLHTNILEQVLGSSGSSSLLHSYHRSFNGFVAKLTEDDAKRLANMKGVVSVFHSQKKQLHTTRSWDFMGFSRHPMESHNLAFRWRFVCRDYFNDVIAIGAFHSMKNGILTSNSAGNSGPDLATVTNVSPWSLSVAAITIDRKFVTEVMLGNGEIYKGISINTIQLKDKMFSLIYGGDAPNTKDGYDSSESRYCWDDSMDKALVAGKIVFCDEVNSGEGAISTGTIGAIMEGYLDAADNFPLPVSYLGTDNGTEVFNYLNSTSKPTATIFKSIQEKDEQAPYVISFSSRGPNPITYDTLKPDLTAPGVDILAAWSQGTTVTGLKGDNRIVPYNIISGTSMSCPHATAAAAYVKSFNPTWSPAAIKSALMTTGIVLKTIQKTSRKTVFNLISVSVASAVPLSLETNTDAEFAFGSGHLIPSSALDPGLVNDAGEIDYVKFLCGQGYNTTTLRLITGDRSRCSKAINGTAWDLNYPSFALSVVSGKSTIRVFHRTVTNVGLAVSVYKATASTPYGLEIDVEPNVLRFKVIGETKSFVVRVKAKIDDDNTNMMASGSLIWDDGVHQVRSPVVAFAVPEE